MKKSKRVISIMLCVVLMMTTLFSTGILPDFGLKAEAADKVIDGVSQTQIVTDTSVYDTYAANYLNGASFPTNIVIPGLDPAQDYVIQGVTYYPARDWMLVTAYHNDETASSKVFALDAATGDFVAMFSFLNPDGSVNMDHGGGITLSENNLYYSCGDKDRMIAYAPLSALENAPIGQHTTIQLVDKIDFVEVGSISSDDKTAYTAYVCYDEGILWAGNFYDIGAKFLGNTIAAADYNAPANNQYNTMVFGYKLAGNSSAEEWEHLKGTFQNRLNVTTASGTGTKSGSNFSWKAYQNGNVVSIAGSITAPTALVDEFIGDFGSFTLTEGKNYTIEFTTNSENTDMYMFAPTGAHCNMRQASTKTPLGDGRYRYTMNFTAGLRPAGADSLWPTTQSTDGSYTGTYTIRFDQDAIQAGETREFSITDIKISQTNTYPNAEKNVYDEGSAGSPSYAIALSNSLKDVQYAVVDNGKLYLSRSYGSGAGNSVSFGFGETSQLTVADIDLSVPGDREVTISTTSTGSLDKKIMAYEINDFDNFPMMPMAEGLCVIDDNIFITFESASNKYLNESGTGTVTNLNFGITNCEKPVDVIWQLDPYELMEQTVAEPENSIYYEKVNSLSEIENGEEYLILYESSEKDPVTQSNILYALNADGNFKDYKLSKSTASTVNGYDGMVGHPITYYSYEGDKLYIEKPEQDDIESVRWTLTNVGGTNYRITSTEPYFANCNNLYFDNDQISMAPGNASYLSNIQIDQLFPGDGNFYLSNGGAYFLWCNDGVKDSYNTAINSYYVNNGGTTVIYSGISEQKGTIHCDAVNATGSNVIGASVPEDDGHYYEGAFKIYKRVVDSVASTYESRVYSDLTAELQADGTYTVNLETYAISPNHYQYRDVKPTDYIIVADTSNSMGGNGGAGVIAFPNDLEVNSLSVSANTSDDNGVGVAGYGFSNPNQDIYFKHTDGKYYKIYLAVNTISTGTFNFRQRYWAYYIADDGLYYVLQTSGVCGGVTGGVFSGITQEEFKNHVDNSSTLNDNSQYSNYSTNSSNENAIVGTARQKTKVFDGTHYRFDASSGEYTRIQTLKDVTNNLVGQIAAENLENRIALVQFGADANTGFYNKNGTFTTTDYANAFWSASNASGLQNIINGLTTSTQTSNDGIEFTYVNSIMANSGIDYTGADSDRNVAVIFISDGVAGADSGSGSVAAADKVISKALTAKKAGAFVYTAMISADGTSFDRKLYMDAVSSKYAEATSMSTQATLGGQSVDGVNYTLNLGSTTINNYLNFGNVVLEETSANNAVGLESLNKNAYLRETLSDAFKFPEDGDYSISTKLVPGVYDAIGRFTFDEDNAVDAATKGVYTDDSKALTDRTLTVTGYDYAKEYIGKNKTEDGNKLEITITGLLPNELAKIQNTSINNVDETAIYKTGAMTDADAFKYFPTEYFNIPKYTYVLDFGMQMYDSDVNGTLKAVSETFKKLDVNNYPTKTEHGLIEITNHNLDLLYSPNPVEGVDSGYCLIQRDNGTYDWFEIEVVPASNVLYEETDMVDGTTGSVAWSEVTSGNLSSNQYQDLSGDNDLYGFDSHYDIEGNVFSNGTALKATTTDGARISSIKKFTFKGTGFDLISACGPNTGVMLISVKDSNGNVVESYIIDTYLSADDGEGYLNSENLLCQVPLVQWTTEECDTYTVQAVAMYQNTAGGLAGRATTRSIDGTDLVAGVAEGVSSEEIAAMFEAAGLGTVEDAKVIWFDDNSIFNGGTGAEGYTVAKRSRAAGASSTALDCYIDGIRVYKPMGDDSASYIASEQNAEYLNIANELASGDQFTSTTTGELSGFLYFAQTDSDKTLTFTNYHDLGGPLNEIYLKGSSTTSSGIAFKSGLMDASGRVMIGLKSVTGKPLTVRVNNTTFTVKSATEMYYDVTDCLTYESGEAIVAISNETDGTILAVNNLKLVSAAVATTGLDEIGDVQAYMSAPAVRAVVNNGVVSVAEDDVNTDVDTNVGTGDDNTAGGVIDTEFDVSNLPGMDYAIALIQNILERIISIVTTVFDFLPIV